MMQTVPKKQVAVKAQVKAAATPTQKSSSSEDSSSEEEEEEQKKPMKKKPGDQIWGVKLHDVTRAHMQKDFCSHHVDLCKELLDMSASFSQRKEKSAVSFIT